MKSFFQKVQSFIARHEAMLLPVFLLFGFAVDSLTLRRVDLLPETILVYAYLALSGTAIFLAHLIEEGVWKGKFADKAAPFLPLLLTYAIGSLFSAFVVFYVKSASITDSWPFIVALFSVVVGIEVLKKYEHRFVFYLAIYFLALFSFSIFAVPLWVGEIGTQVFILSAVCAVVLFLAFIGLLFLTGKERIRKSFFAVAASASALLLAVAGLYASNLLPPIPLVLKDIGVYQDVTKRGSEYVLVGESYTFIDQLFGIKVHPSAEGELYVFSSVFTPIAITTDIVHQWERWDPLKEEWVPWSRISFPAQGGREEGYRGFSMTRNAAEGVWKVSVETADGLKIGRIEFTVLGGEARSTVSEVR